MTVVSAQRCWLHVWNPGCTFGTLVSSLSSAGVPGAATMHTAVRSADRSGLQIGQGEEAMGLEPAGQARSAPSAIAADRIFDGHRWHHNAVIVIDNGTVQCIAPCDQGAGDWPTEIMPPG